MTSNERIRQKQIHPSLGIDYDFLQAASKTHYLVKHPYTHTDTHAQPTTMLRYWWHTRRNAALHDTRDVMTLQRRISGYHKTVASPS